MGKHTPGPWFFDKKLEIVSLAPGYWWGFDHKPHYLEAEIPGFHEFDAHLIAAAPELLELVKSYYEYAGRFAPHRLPKIEAAIEKAEGRTP